MKPQLKKILEHLIRSGIQYGLQIYSPRGGGGRGVIAIQISREDAYGGDCRILPWYEGGEIIYAVPEVVNMMRSAGDAEIDFEDEFIRYDDFGKDDFIIY